MHSGLIAPISATRSTVRGFCMSAPTAVMAASPHPLLHGIPDAVNTGPTIRGSLLTGTGSTLPPLFARFLAFSWSLSSCAEGFGGGAPMPCSIMLTSTGRMPRSTMS